MGFFDRISEGLQRSRDKFKEQMNVLLDRGPDLDDEFWETLEETLVLSDVGAPAACDIVERLQDQARRQALPDAYAVLDLLKDHIAETFTPGGDEILGGDPALVLFVGINGTGKTTTVGKIAKESVDKGRAVILGSADTFRAAAIEQLEVWAERANVEMVTRERGSDPASVCYDTIERAEEIGADLVLIDTAGRLHTSADLMRELEKVVTVVRKRSSLPVYTVLVIDATTGQNGLQQAREFNRALQLDALIVTKLDGTAKGGIALAVSHELELPIIKIGVGERIEDLRDFDALDFAAALIGDFDERYDEESDGLAAECEGGPLPVYLEAEERAAKAAEAEASGVPEEDDAFEARTEEVQEEGAEATVQDPVGPEAEVFAEEANGSGFSDEFADVEADEDTGETALETPTPEPDDGFKPEIAADSEEGREADFAMSAEPAAELEPESELEPEAEPKPEPEPETELEPEPEAELEPEPEQPRKKHFWERWF